MNIELMADYACQVGEAPLWHPIEKRIYWSDIVGGRLFRLDPKTGEHEEFYRGDMVGGMTLQADGQLMLFMMQGEVALWQEGKLDQVVKEIPEERGFRFNDVFVDPIGRVFCGSMAIDGTELGRLYRLDVDGSMTVVADGIGISNGMGLTPDLKQMYYTDSSVGEIYIFDYDQETGDIGNKRVFVKVPEAEGVPDGMTVDVEGFVWSARWHGGAVYRYDPTGIEQMRVEIPVPKVSSVTFGGDDMMDMYVTTAIEGSTKEIDGEHAGGLFRARPGVKGQKEFFSRVKL